MSLEEKTIKKAKKAGAGRPTKPINYDRAEYWSRRLVSQKILASKLGLTPRGLRKRMARDLRLRQAVDGSYNDALISLEVELYQKAIEHRITICQACGKRFDGFEWYPSCPACGSHNVHHQHKRANTRLLIHLCKHKLGQTRTALLRQSERPGSIGAGVKP